MIAGFAPAVSSAGESPLRSVLFLSQWDPDLPWYGAASSAFHETWYQYRWLIIAILAVVLTQAAMITSLFFERHRRRIAEIELRQRLIEVIHLNRMLGLLAAFVAVMLESPPAATQTGQQAAARDAATRRCIAQANQQVPGGESQDMQRAARTRPAWLMRVSSRKDCSRLQ